MWLAHIRECSSTSHSGLHIQPAAVYLLRFPTVGLYKVGVTAASDPMRRIRDNNTAAIPRSSRSSERGTAGARV